MRPIKLELEGFTAFRRWTTLNFDKMDLVCITGPTGAGKTSILDAMCFALYGRTPRLGREIRQLISHGKNFLQVAFAFEAGGGRFRIFRRIYRDGRTQVQLQRWTGSRWEGIEDRAEAATKRISELLGMDFDTFRRSVLLPQGEFARFLVGSPEEKRKTLYDLLQLELYRRMQELAGQRGRQQGEKLEFLRKRLEEEYLEATPLRLQEVKRKLSEIEREEGKLHLEISALEEAEKKAGELERLGAEISQKRKRRRELEVELERVLAEFGKLREEMGEIERRLAYLEEEARSISFDQAKFERLAQAKILVRDLQRTREERRRQERLCEQKEAEVRRAERRKMEAWEKLASAELVERRAQERYERASREDARATLLQGVKPGDPCPICSTPLAEIPPVARPSLQELQEARRFRDEAERRRREAERAHSGAEKQLERAIAEYENAKRRMEELEREEREREGRLRELVSGICAPEEGEISEAFLREEEAARRRERIQKERELLHKSLQEKQSRLLEIMERRRGDEHLISELEREILAAERELEERRRELLELARSRSWEEIERALREGNPLEVIEAFLRSRRERWAALQQEKGGLRRRIEEIQEKIKYREKLESEMKRIKAELDLYLDIAEILRADKFIAWILEEALGRLADRAGEKLEELSAGRYTLRVEGQEFLVVDHWNADEIRRVSTLSGGETFLGSLALALALAEEIPGLSAGRGEVMVESMFLDEGFGTLDRESLDLAAQALEALRGKGRFVCVVTHLEELAQRFPYIIRVIKEPSGSRVEQIA